MHYVLNVIGASEAGEHDVVETAEEIEAQVAAVDRFNEKLAAQGRFVFAAGLRYPSASTVVDARGPETLLTDGPFLESKECVAGLWVIEAADLDEALALAA